MSIDLYVPIISNAIVSLRRHGILAGGHEPDLLSHWYSTAKEIAHHGGFNAQEASRLAYWRTIQRHHVETNLPQSFAEKTAVAHHDETLKSIFADPVRANIKWTDVERLLIHLGTELSEGRGSRVRIALNGERAVFHRPHPSKEMDKGAVRSMRQFLLNAGIRP